jgi:hypothetical protein
MTRVYVSGPMSGIVDSNFPAFNAAARELRRLGYEVVNPAEINPGDPPPPDAGESAQKHFWRQCLRADVKELCDCDMVALLPGWEDSSGAHLEVHIAHRLGIKVRALHSILLDVFEPEVPA